MSRRKCVIEHCENPPTYTDSGLCNTCYVSLRYWCRKTPTKLVQRARTLKKFEARHKFLTGVLK